MIVMATPVTTQCVVSAAQIQRVPLNALVGLMRVEYGHVGELSKNANGTYDVGPMEINSSWKQALSHWNVSMYTLRYNGCLNVMVGAWILRHYWNQVGGTPTTLWEAIGHYHSHNAKLKDAYEWKVYENLAHHLTITGVVNHANEWFCKDNCTASVATSVAQSSANRATDSLRK